VLAYIPLLVVRRGAVTPDTKTYLYLDPGRFLSQVAFLWNPTVGLGTVTHEYIGYLLPMGPFYGMLALLHTPSGWPSGCGWAPCSSPPATGSSTCPARCGCAGPGPLWPRWPTCCRRTSCSTPAGFRSSLLPWAGLPFMVAFTILALRRGGWRMPALFAIVVALVSGINASSIIYVGIAPVLWLLYAVVVLREATWRQALWTALRVGC
jgi:arabinofuranan 3-O-arabinosyltransferase